MPPRRAADTFPCIEPAAALNNGGQTFDNRRTLNSRILPMLRFAALTLALTLPAAAALAQSAPDAKPAPRAPSSRQELKSEAKGLALATDTAETISANQLTVAARVLTGKADCEMNQNVDVDAVDGQPGVFKVRFKNASYVMVPEETSTGAVRLFDRKAGVVWLQIPMKSMLLDHRAGQRLVDNCMQSEQRAAVNAAAAAAAPRK